MTMYLDSTSALLAILGVAVATYAMRFGGLLLSEHIPQSGAFKAFMEALPGTILLSLVVPGIFNAGPWGWIAAAATALTAHKTGNLFISMALGVAIVALERNLLS